MQCLAVRVFVCGSRDATIYQNCNHSALTLTLTEVKQFYNTENDQNGEWSVGYNYRENRETEGRLVQQENVLRIYKLKIANRILL